MAVSVRVLCLLILPTIISCSFAYRWGTNNKANEVVFDDTPGLGRTFEGIGAISGGGATSKLLVTYERPRRNEILDFLFKPNFGASLQIFKVEIGGDMQSTDGTEASHMHNEWDENYHRGYEWFLMKEAKKRNPNIKLYGLPWGFPGWLGDDNKNDNSPYGNPERTADYVTRWVNAAKTVHGLDIDYVGIWNERHYNTTYIKTLRKMLDTNGFTKTLIIAADEKWEIANDIEKDKELAEIVHAIGCHYPGTESSSKAKETKKLLWASEDYSTYNNEVGGGCWARILNQNYVNGFMTSTISWNLIGSYYEGLPFYRDGLMTAVEPWSGHYNVSTPIWISAHTTQFVPIGWTYLNHTKGVGHLPQGGSYVSLTNEARDQITIVLETMTHDHSKCIRPWLPKYNVTAQTINITLKGSFAKIQQMNVWYSKLGFDGEQNQMFLKKDPLVFTNGQASLSLGLDEIYTLTTVTTGQKGKHPEPPPSAPFPSTIKDDFSGYGEGEEPNYLAPQAGTLEIVKVKDRKVARQMVLQMPVHWCNAEKGKPISLVGNASWTDMEISVTFELPEVNATDGVFVAVRVNEGGCHVNGALGVFFFVFPITNKYIVSKDLARTKVLTEGSITPTTGPRELNLLIQDKVAVGKLDQVQIFNLNLTQSSDHMTSDSTKGFAGIGTDNYGYADFHSYYLKQH